MLTYNFSMALITQKSNIDLILNVYQLQFGFHSIKSKGSFPKKIL